MKKTTKAHEDYLETIVELGGTPTTAVRSVDIAIKLGVSKASVNKAVGHLKQQELLDQPHYGDITLTEEGYEYGSAILERHQLLFNFLTQQVGIEEKAANEEACLMEHAISDDSFDKWIAYIKDLDTK